MKKLILTILIFSIGFLSGCNDFLEEEPKSFAAAENLFNSKNGIEQVLMGVYEAGREAYRGRYYIMMYGITSDDIHYHNSNTSRIEMENYVFTAENGNLARSWETNVYGINRANMVLDYLPETFRDQAFIDRIEAEAKFLRAWYYFGQVRSYGPVPLITEYRKAEQFPTNSTIPEIYAQIIQDLKDAEDKLPGWTEMPSNQLGRATNGAVKSLLAWVYLTKATSDAAEANDYSNAAAKAKEVIDEEGYGLWENYNDAFLPSSENGKEDVFAFQFEAGTRFNNSIQADFGPNPDIFGQAAYQNFSLKDELYNLFAPEDERLELVLKGEYSLEGDPNIYVTPDNQAFPQKFRDPENKNRNDHGTNLPFIRYSNVLLIYAEAANEANPTPPADAIAAFNLVRERANVDPIVSPTKEQFRQAIRDERYMEFHGEGIRWFDLVRWGILEERVEATNPNADVQMPKHQFFPIPQSEIDANTNLVQNAGYSSAE